VRRAASGSPRAARPQSRGSQPAVALSRRRPMGRPLSRPTVRVPRRFVVVALALVLAAVVRAASGIAEVSLARLPDAAAPTLSVTTDTLDPPTSLSATGGAVALLSWTATVDTYATGYDVLRGSVSGGPYSVVGSITPRTTVTTGDTPPASGTWYYVVRS